MGIGRGVLIGVLRGIGHARNLCIRGWNGLFEHKIGRAQKLGDRMPIRVLLGMDAGWAIKVARDVGTQGEGCENPLL